MLPDPFPDAGSPLAAILAGGASRRFGAPKGLARIGARTLVARIAEAAHGAHLEAVLITSEPERHAELELRSRPDLIAGVGPLGGIHAALRWAEEEGRPGVLALPCDAPFLSAGLLRAIVQFADGAEAVLPESTGPRGVEPLCAFYPVRCIAHVEALLAAGTRDALALGDAVAARRLPLEDVRRWGDPDLLFLNINTPEDHARALHAAAGIDRRQVNGSAA